MKTVLTWILRKLAGDAPADRSAYIDLDSPERRQWLTRV